MRHALGTIEQHHSANRMRPLGDHAHRVDGAEHVGLVGERYDSGALAEQVVERFERFPHRNAILGRTSSTEEAAFLQQHDDF
ncbi:MAG: DUF924 domain-containing protein [Deltaproteobacteria bacterium]|nr:DUF924 domain-containing protein [Deltaproteobacteria bacterium]